MFEDSTFESNGKIRTRGRGWMIASCAFNGSILLALVLFPLLYPAALPHMALAFLMEAPPAPTTPPKPVVRVEHADLVQPEIRGGIIFAPRTIPHAQYIAERPEYLPDVDVATMGGDDAGAEINPFGNNGQQHPIVREQVKGPMRVSGLVVEGMLIQKNPPQYPAIAKATGTQGTVVLQATISRNGTIENLHVVSGPTLLQQAALDAVKNWRYRPYLLSGEPVEVETTVNVIFRMQ